MLSCIHLFDFFSLWIGHHNGRALAASGGRGRQRGHQVLAIFGGSPVSRLVLQSGNSTPCPELVREWRSFCASSRWWPWHSPCPATAYSPVSTGQSPANHAADDGVCEHVFFFDVFFMCGTLTWRNAITLPYYIGSCKLTCRDGSR